MKNIINLIVNDSNKNQRVDVFINKCENSLSRTRIKNLILKKKLKINDKKLLIDAMLVTIAGIAAAMKNVG